MYYTGFADEAATGIDGQIKATQALGWENIESRNIDGVNIHDLSDEQFEIVAGKLSDAGVHINCFGSAVANWSKNPTSDQDFEDSLAMLNRAIPRMQHLGTKMLRGMSFMMMKDLPPNDPQIEKLVIEKLKKLVERCEDAGIEYIHENCMNFGGQSAEHTMKLVEAMNSDHFKLVFDTGNPVMTDQRTGEPPYKKQRAWDFYLGIKDHIHYVHIKDGIFQEETGSIFPKAKFTYPGEGDGDIKRIVKDLLASGYDGGFSMEPHLNVVFHEEDPHTKAEVLMNSYIEYGRRFMDIVKECQTA